MESTEKRATPIQEFYRDTNIFITGGTGFMGKVLIEKLLRSCPHINSIFLLVRSKRGKDQQTRIQELFEDPLYEKLKTEQPNFREKIIVVEGDSSLAGLGLSPEDRHSIVNNVHIVFHMAAIVRFDEKLQVAVATNVQGTRNAMLLCKDCINIKVVVHVSTAYTHCHLPHITEEFHEPPITGDKIIQLMECLDEDLLTRISPILLENWPNTYAFSKAIAEDTVKKFGKDLPVGVFRPSIVVSTNADPVAGWIDNLYGPTGAIMGMGMGVIRCVHLNGNAVADFIPCDIVISALVASAWDIHERRKSNSEDIPIYNCVSSCENPVRWGLYSSLSTVHIWNSPFNATMWKPFLKQIKSRQIYNMYVLALHQLPALLLDTMLFIRGRKPKMIKTYKKLHRYLDATSMFRLQEWTFSNDNIQLLWRKMSAEDREIFNFDVKCINWDQFMAATVHGLRTYMLKDDPKTLPKAITRINRLYWIHQFTKLSIICLFLWPCRSAIRPIYNSALRLRQ